MYLINVWDNVRMTMMKAWNYCNIFLFLWEKSWESFLARESFLWSVQIYCPMIQHLCPAGWFFSSTINFQFMFLLPNGHTSSLNKILSEILENYLRPLESVFWSVLRRIFSWGSVGPTLISLNFSVFNSNTVQWVLTLVAFAFNILRSCRTFGAFTFHACFQFEDFEARRSIITYSFLFMFNLLRISC